MVDNHWAVKVGDLEKNVESRPMVKPKFTNFLESVVREGADELTLRAEDEGVLRTIDTTDVGDSGTGATVRG